MLVCTEYEKNRASTFCATVVNTFSRRMDFEYEQSGVAKLSRLL